MAFQAVPGGVSLNIRYVNDLGEFWGENTVWFRWDGGGEVGTSQLNALLDIYEDVWASNFDALTSTNAGVNRITATSHESETSPSVVRTVGLTGTQVVNILPPNATIAVSLRTALRGRSYRGRVFQCALTEAMTNRKQIETAYITAIPDAWNALRGLAPDAEFQMAVCSRYADGAARPTGVLTTVTDIGLTDTKTDSMKTRLRG